MQARAAVIERKDSLFVIQDVTVEDPRPDEVLVRMVATGICATDAHLREQLLPAPLPVILGHEGAGIVERVGSTVTHLRPGDHVVLSEDLLLVLLDHQVRRGDSVDLARRFRSRSSTSQRALGGLHRSHIQFLPLTERF